MVFEDLLNGSVLVVIFAASFYYFGYLLDSHRDVGYKSDRYIDGFFYVMNYIFLPVLSFCVAFYFVPIKTFQLFVLGYKIDIISQCYIFMLFQILLMAFFIFFLNILNPSSSESGKIAIWVRTYVKKIGTSALGNVFFLLSCVLIFMCLYFAYYTNVDSVSFYVSPNSYGGLLNSVFKNFALFWFPVLFTFLLLSFFATTLSYIGDRFKMVKVYLSEGSIPICGQLVMIDSNYVSVLNDVGKLIQINKDFIKIVERY